MLTLQGTFKYEGDITKSPFKSLNLKFKYPAFDYEKSEMKTQSFSRKIVASESFNALKELNEVDYYVDLPTNSIIGKDLETVYNFLAYTEQAISKDVKNIDDLLLKIDVQYADSDDTIIGGCTFNVFYYVKRAEDAPATKEDLSLSLLSAYIEKNVFLVNKEAYKSMLDELKPIDPGSFSREFFLLDIIAFLVDLKGGSPKLMETVDKTTSESFLILKNNEALNIIKARFQTLFDFPVSIPQIKTLDVAGTFAINTFDVTQITKDDFLFYNLSLEYLTLDSQGKSNFNGTRFNWVTNKNDVKGNKTAFSFTDTRPIIFNNITGLLGLNVKSFNGELLWSKDYMPDDPALKEIQIEVSLQRPNVLMPFDKKDTPGTIKKLRGQILELSKKCSLSDITIVIQAKKEGDEEWRIVGAAKTDKSGNFSMPYPFGVYTAAQAIVSLTPDEPADIYVNTDNKENQTISDDFLYLLIKEADCEKLIKEEGNNEDCDCHSPKKAARLPDHSDLINSDEYTQDIGGSCINLSTPNRTLNEYPYQAIVRISDPDVANYTLTKYQDGHFELAGSTKPIDRKKIDLDNPLRWQDAPDLLDSQENLTVYQSVTIATGHILHYKSEFKADGYSLGNLLYSLPLAPGQKKEIVVIDSAHSLLGAESQSMTQTEGIAAGITNERSITDQLSGNFNEDIYGRSSASTSGVSAGLGIAGTIGFASGALGVAGGYANANASGSQNSSRSTAQFFGEQLRQSIMQKSEAYRQLNASVVTTVKEGQRYTATTEVVANHNHCHSLTMMYFEVLRHFAIFQELVNVEECVFVPLLMTNFSIENIYKWRDILAKYLLPIPSNTYLRTSVSLDGLYAQQIVRQHPLLRAFDAIERKKTSYANVDFPAGSYDNEQISFIKGEINLRTNLSRPKTRYDRVNSFPIATTEVDRGGFFGWIADGLFGKNSTTNPQPPIDEYISVDANYSSVLPRDCVRVIKFDDKFFDTGIIDKNLWTNYASILEYTGSKNVFNMLDYYFKGRLISEWDDIYYNDIAPVLFDKIVDSIKIEFISTDLTSITKYKGGDKLMRLRFNGTASKKRNEFPIIIKLFSNSENVKALKDLATLTIENCNIYYATSHYNGILFSGYVNNDLSDGTDLYIPENSDEKRDPHKEDNYLANKLIEHLNSNLEYYNRILWRNLDENRRYMLLDGFNIQIFDDFGLPAGFRSLASVVKNQIISVVGNALVLPVAAGYKVSQSFITERTEGDVHQEVTLLDHYKPLTPIPPYRISVPSRGVFAEAVQGACDACEKIKENSSQDWTKFTTDEPTPIAPITTPVPTITDWKAAFKDFATPMINIQNAPSTPEPGAGLVGLSDLLGKAGIFKDVSGLDANQQNALKTYLSNQENAKAFAQMAMTMGMQSHNTQNSDKIMDGLSTAKDSGAISQQDYNALVKDHLQQQIDGGASKKTELTNTQTAKPTLTDAAVDAAAQGRQVEATKTDDTGNTESIKIGNNDNTDSIKSDIEGADAGTKIKVKELNAAGEFEWEPAITDDEEIKELLANRWAPSTDDFVAIPGGTVTVTPTFGEFISMICGQEDESISRINLFTHANKDIIAFGGHIEKGMIEPHIMLNVNNSSNNLISIELNGLNNLTGKSFTPAKPINGKSNFALEDIRKKFAKDAIIVFYACHSGSDFTLIKAISKFFNVKTIGFNVEIGAFPPSQKVGQKFMRIGEKIGLGVGGTPITDWRKLIDDSKAVIATP